ncbi:hypothetical protein THRCLA_23249 [Thraustotheca clavata]|uniref:Uncharacterized protein n=1 Tax=Thraustotheca clavata TaxID=74557 RepID=A0A1V9Y8P5_9STRA|nr:hypothetical protein THRCLA_23249 [Thraustotheca clavata]
MSTPRSIQEDDIERLVKCRVRSEVEARKAAETTMKRAMKEATELKKELMLMRKEKAEWRFVVDLVCQSNEIASSQRTTEAPPKSVKHSSDDLLKKLNRREKDIEQLNQTLLDKDAAIEGGNQQQLQLQTQLDKATSASIELQRQLDEANESNKKTIMELRQQKLASEEARKKYQKNIKDLKDEKQQLVAENTQLTQRLEDSTSANAQTNQLKKQLQQARERLSTVVQEQDIRMQQLSGNHSLAVQELTKEHEEELKNQAQKLNEKYENDIQEKVQATSMLSQIEKEKEQVRADALRRLQEELKIEKEENVDLLQTVKSLQDKLRLVSEMLCEADRAKAEAEAEKERVMTMSSKLEHAADVCEAQAQKYKEEWIALEEKLAVVDAALRRRGISMEFLLKKKPSGNNNTEGDEEVAKSTKPLKKEIKKKSQEPELRDESDKKPIRTQRK